MTIRFFQRLFGMQSSRSGRNDQLYSVDEELTPQKRNASKLKSLTISSWEKLSTEAFEDGRSKFGELVELLPERSTEEVLELAEKMAEQELNKERPYQKLDREGVMVGVSNPYSTYGGGHRHFAACRKETIGTITIERGLHGRPWEGGSYTYYYSNIIVLRTGKDTYRCFYHQHSHYSPGD